MKHLLEWSIDSLAEMSKKNLADLKLNYEDHLSKLEGEELELYKERYAIRLKAVEHYNSFEEDIHRLQLFEATRGDESFYGYFAQTFRLQFDNLIEQDESIVLPEI